LGHAPPTLLDDDRSRDVGPPSRCKKEFVVMTIASS
jgi:hypothetical protein